MWGDELDRRGTDCGRGGCEYEVASWGDSTLVGKDADELVENGRSRELEVTG
jgi:hypothetical protein